MFDNTIKAAGVVIATLALISCDSGAFLAPGEDGPNEINGVEVASITLDPTPLLVEDDTVALHASALDATGEPIEDPELELTWSSTEESVATLESTGSTDAELITRSPGTTTLTASYDQISASTTIEVHNRPVDLVYVAGGDQQGTPGATLPDSLAVRIVDKRGDAVDGVYISFAVTAGGGSLSRTGGSTDTSGTVRTAWTLGDAGPQEVRARASEDQPRVKKMHNSEVIFTAIVEDTTLAVESVTVTPDSAVVDTSGTVDLDADVRDTRGNSVSSRTVSWASSNTAVARVDAEGLVTAVAEGAVLISATAGGVTGTSDVTVASSSDGTLTISASADTLYGIGDTLTLSVEARNADGTVIAEPDVQWSSSDPDIATVDTMGTVISRALGTAIIAAAAACCDGGDFVEVAVVDDTTSVDTTAPATVTDLSVVTVGENSVTLEWSQVDDGTGNPADYAVRYGSPDLSWGSAHDSEITVGGTAIGETASHTVSGLSSGTNYEFGLVSYRGTLGVDVTFGNTSNFVATTTSAGAVGPVDYIVASPSNHTFTQIGNTLRISATARDSLGQTVPDVEFGYFSTDASVVSVDSLGTMTANALGSSSIVVTAVGWAIDDTIQAAVDTTGAAPFFQDDFESYSDGAALSGGNSDFSWGANGPENPHVSTDIARNGSKSFKFPAPASVQFNNEQRFSFSDLTELATEYYLYLPDGTEGISGVEAWDHGSDSPSNDKFFVYWPEDYNQKNPGGTPYVLAELWSVGTIEIARSWGEAGDEDYMTRGNWGQPGDKLRSSLFDPATDRGEWIRIRVYIKLADYGVGNGIIKVWKNDALVIESTNEHLYPLDEERWNYLSQAYIMGAHNAGKDVATAIYMDDFKIYNGDPGW